MVWCYKELINYYLGENQKKYALRVYEQLAQAYKEKGDKDALLLTYQKMLKLNPEREDIKLKLQQESSIDIPFIREVMHIFAGLVKKGVSPKKIITIVISLIFLLLFFGVFFREWQAVNRLEYYKQKIKNNQFSQIKEELFLFWQSPYLLGTHNEASSLYREQISIENNNKLTKAKRRLKADIEHIYSELLGSEKYQEILQRLYNLQKQVYTYSEELRIPLFAILRSHIQDIEQKKSKFIKFKNQQLYELAFKRMKEGQFELAKKLARKVMSYAPEVWTDRVLTLLEKIKIAEEKAKKNQKLKILKQKNLFEYAQRLKAKGKLEQSISNFEKLIKLLPDSKYAQDAYIHIQRIRNVLNEGRKYLNKAKRLVQMKRYEQSLTYYSKILNDERFTHTEMVNNILLPLQIETKPVENIDCFVNGTKIGSTPTIYFYRPGYNVDNINIKNNSFKIYKKERKDKSGYPSKIILYLKRVPLWKFETNETIKSSLLLTKTNIYVGGGDTYFYCLNKMGGLSWKLKLARFSKIVGDMTLEGDNLYFVTQRGRFYYLKLKQIFGEPEETIHWEKQFNFVNKEKKLEPVKFYSGPLVYKKRYFFLGGSDGFVHLCIYKGNKQFSLYKMYKTDSKIKAKPLIIGNKIIVCDSEGIVYCFDLKTRNLIWKSQKLVGNIVGSPTYQGNKIFVGTSPGGIYCFTIKKDTKAVKAPIWTRRLPGGVKSTPLVHNQKLWIGADRKNIYAIDIKNGEIVHSIFTQGGFAVSPIICKDKLLLGGKDFAFYAVSLNTGKLEWKHTLPERCYGKPVCDGEKIYIAAGKTIFAYSIKDILNNE